MSGEIIEVCQECGHIIDNPPIDGPDGKRYRILLCLRDKCMIDRITRSSRGWFADEERWTHDRLAAMRYARMTFPVVAPDPKAFFLTTGV